MIIFSHGLLWLKNLFLDFKGKIVAKFLLRSHFLSKCNNMTIKQHINLGPIQKVCHLNSGNFYSINRCTLSQFHSFTSLVLFTKNSKLWNERKEDFFMYGCLSVSRYIKGGRKSCRVLRHSRIFRPTCMYKQPIFTK